MHHFASFNNQFYRKSIEYMQDVVGHAAEQMVRRLPRSRGLLQRPLRPADQGADRYAGSAGRPRLHVVPRHRPRGQLDGQRRISPSSIRRCTSWPRSKNQYIRAIDYFLTYLNPEPHRQTFMKPFMREDSAEFCSACHKVHLDVPVNNYRWFRGFNDYDNWQASGVSGQGARSFYYPPKSSTCVGLPHAAGRVEGSGQSRRQGPLASLPGGEHGGAVRQSGRGQMEATEKFLKSGFITVDIFAVSPVDETKRADRRCCGATRRPAADVDVRGGRRGGAARARW